MLMILFQYEKERHNFPIVNKNHEESEELEKTPEHRTYIKFLSNYI